MINAGWNKSSTKYVMMLGGGAAEAYTGGNCPSGQTCYVLGAATSPGSYALIARTEGSTTLRFGCATVGDSIMAHETTHEFGVSHTTDNANDLMNAFYNGRTLRSSPSLLWDYNRDGYSASVSNSNYVVGSEATSSTYYSC